MRQNSDSDRNMGNIVVNNKYIMNNLPEGIIAPIIDKDVTHSFLIIGCKYDEKKIGISREKFLEKLTKKLPLKR